MLNFRLISEMTIEENILKKANQKRLMSDVAIEGGNFTTAFFKQVRQTNVMTVSNGKNDVAWNKICIRNGNFTRVQSDNYSHVIFDNMGVNDRSSEILAKNRFIWAF